jgi:hypothetical protein
MLFVLNLGASSLSLAVDESEVLLDFKVDNETLMFRVFSRGCTYKSDFVLEITPGTPLIPQFVITLRRLRLDPCKGFDREGKLIVFSKQELGLPRHSQIEMTNRILKKR